ncbi:hypothetical protein ASG36_14610 [Geodermatophilus sp. Leaf369]|uniref:hypothetical protein n=1 Tax=Geodermatophilus sp. Leaf369 TaxID=1736354 RepID=UPI0006F99FDB|nr:hypothetical protein [Geodermatophilus sp. Leaf369]KQS57820.1 hypothetical protein ASG36_14610 [Geodermatophilus sp. Leaf369]
MTSYRIGQARRMRTLGSSMDGRDRAVEVLDGPLHALAPDQVHADGDQLGTAVCGDRVQLSGEREFDPAMLVDVGICPRCRRRVAAD